MKTLLLVIISLSFYSCAPAEKASAASKNVCAVGLMCSDTQTTMCYPSDKYAQSWADPNYVCLKGYEGI